MTKKERTTEDDIKDDVRKYSALEAVGNTDGGKILITNLKSDILAVIDQIGAGYGKYSHTELISLAARMQERLLLYRTLTNAPINKKDAREALKELLNPSEE